MSAPTGAMPAVYIPHGGGPGFFVEGPMAQVHEPLAAFLAALPTLLPRRPSAILVASAHWEAPASTLSAAANHGLLYDYYGFPPETYELRYPAPGAPDVAVAAAELLHGAGIRAVLDHERGWDHGVFIPLLVALPDADIPVVAMSLVDSLDPAVHLAVGEALRPLREQDVLIIGSGMSFHGPRDPERAASTAFHGWLGAALDGDHAHRSAQLARWVDAPAARMAHPREEHLLPLMVCSGAGSDRPATTLWNGPFARSTIASYAFD